MSAFQWHDHDRETLRRKRNLSSWGHQMLLCEEAIQTTKRLLRLWVRFSDLNAYLSAGEIRWLDSHSQFICTCISCGSLHLHATFNNAWPSENSGSYPVSCRKHARLPRGCTQPTCCHSCRLRMYPPRLCHRRLNLKQVQCDALAKKYAAQTSQLGTTSYSSLNAFWCMFSPSSFTLKSDLTRHVLL